MKIAERENYNYLFNTCIMKKADNNFPMEAKQRAMNITIYKEMEKHYVAFWKRPENQEHLKVLKKEFEKQNSLSLFKEWKCIDALSRNINGWVRFKELKDEFEDTFRFFIFFSWEEDKEIVISGEDYEYKMPESQLVCCIYHKFKNMIPRKIVNERENVSILNHEEKTKTNGTEKEIKGAIFIKDYSKKSFAVFGDTKPAMKDLRGLGGSFNPWLKQDGECVPGWIFPIKRKNKVEEFINT